MFSLLFTYLKKCVKDFVTNSKVSSNRALDDYYRIEYCNETDLAQYNAFQKISSPVYKARIQNRLGDWWYEDRNIDDLYRYRMK